MREEERSGTPNDVKKTNRRQRVCPVVLEVIDARAPLQQHQQQQ